MGAETTLSVFAGITPTTANPAHSTIIPAAKNAMIELDMKPMLQKQTHGSDKTWPQMEHGFPACTQVRRRSGGPIARPIAPTTQQLSRPGRDWLR